MISEITYKKNTIINFESLCKGSEEWFFLYWQIFKDVENWNFAIVVGQTGPTKMNQTIGPHMFSSYFIYTTAEERTELIFMEKTKNL